MIRIVLRMVYSFRSNRDSISFLDYFSLKRFYIKFSRLDLTPHYYHAFFLLGAICRHRSKAWFDFTRFVRANQLPSSPIPKTSELPSIELLLIVAMKDFVTLPVAISKAVKNSLNPISVIRIVTPHDAIVECEKVIKNLEVSIPICIDDEDEVFSLVRRLEMKELFGRKYGWGLQQFLTVESVLKSSSSGVLALNADTMILRPQVWLDSNFVQILFQSSELHLPYYRVLKSVFPNLEVQKLSHVTHHMLFQPDLLREIFRMNGIGNTGDLFQRLKIVFERDQESPFCIEFEPYAQGMRACFPDKIEVRRFSNIAVSLDTIRAGVLSVVNSFEEESRYNSISLHSWKS
jgi:hypothetical protein